MSAVLTCAMVWPLIQVMYVSAWLSKWKCVYLFTSYKSLGHADMFVCVSWWLEELRAGFRLSRWLRTISVSWLVKAINLFLEKCACDFLTIFWELSVAWLVVLTPDFGWYKVSGKNAHLKHTRAQASVNPNKSHGVALVFVPCVGRHLPSY